MIHTITNITDFFLLKGAEACVAQCLYLKLLELWLKEASLLKILQKQQGEFSLKIKSLHASSSPEFVFCSLLKDNETVNTLLLHESHKI